MKSWWFLMCLVLVSGCVNSEPVACTLDAKICPDGTAVGRVGPDCEFEECPEVIYCDEINKETQGGCSSLYDPVCGFFDESIQCIKAPCAQTYSNGCVACISGNVEFYTRGECDA